MKNYKFKINGKNFEVNINDVDTQHVDVEVNGKVYNVELEQEIRPHKTTVVTSQPSPRVAAANKGDVQKAAPTTKTEKVTTPLPGTILDVFVNVGDTVKAGQTLVLLEAMKMENNIDSDYAGTVTDVKVRKGDSVLEGEVLVEIKR